MISLEIITPDKTIFKGEVKYIQLPVIDGSFGILEHHAPMISALKKGRIKIKNKNNKIEFIEINDGVLEILKNKAIVLAE